MEFYRKVLHAIAWNTRGVGQFAKRFVIWTFCSWFLLGLCVTFNSELFNTLAWLVIIATSPVAKYIAKLFKFIGYRVWLRCKHIIIFIKDVAEMLERKSQY